MVGVANHVVVGPYAFQLLAVLDLAVANVLTKGMYELDLPSIVGYLCISFNVVLDFASLTRAVQHSQLIINDFEHIFFRYFFFYFVCCIQVEWLYLISEKTGEMSVEQPTAAVVKEKEVKSELEPPVRKPVALSLRVLGHFSPLNEYDLIV